MAQRFYIGPYDKDSGLHTNYKPLVIPDRAFAQLDNAYVYRGRVRKRFGSRWIGDSQLSSRFRINVGSTDGAGDGSGTLPQNAAPALIQAPAIGQMFSIGSSIYTVNALGNPADLLQTDGTTTTAELYTTTGVFNFVGAPINETIYWYPNLPVMGLLSVEAAEVNNEPTFGFDTRFAYRYQASGWERIVAQAVPDANYWNGTNAQFFNGTTWSGAEPSDYVFFVSNFRESEPLYMRTNTSGIWDSFRPQVSAFVLATGVLDIFLDSAKLMFVFKNRLVCLNTWESSSPDGVTYTQANYSNRARYSALGSPLDVDAFRQDKPGKGDSIDASTREAIIGAALIRDRLIVYFERSTWELVSSNDVAYPFSWQQINSELGSESTESMVLFDRVALAIGQNGIHACNGNSVERIDNSIPQTVFQIRNLNNGLERVYGIRDYYLEMVYWTYPDSTRTTTQPYPNKVLVYNYTANTWGINDDSITCFGYFQSTNSVSWDSVTVGWDDPASWSGGNLQGLFRQVLAGNQQGYTFIVSADETENAPALQITDIAITAFSPVLRIINHNLVEGDCILLNGIVDRTGNLELLNGKIGRVIAPADPNYATLELADPITVYAGVYQGGGTAQRVSNIRIKSKEFNFFAQQGSNTLVNQVDFLVDRTARGAITADCLVSSNINSILTSSLETGTEMGTGILETSPYPDVDYELLSSRLWHTMAYWADGEYFQLFLYMSPNQMLDPDLVNQDFQLHAIIIHADPSSMRLQ